MGELTKSKRTTIEQGRAAFAFEKVESVPEKNIKEYRSLAKKLPMYIKTNGLGGAFAFSHSKSKSGNEHELILKHISSWLGDPKSFVPFDLPSDSKGLLEELINMDSTAYRMITTEVLSYLNWVRRFADSKVEELKSK
ncbi:type III-B CRISPR module-associated protein Cmr5 [Pontibacter sp. G13]|uniref:type III-B CRISPR module-associated protein Cmr5 n=1 Tax=Pontibacter sp. G13 TaxID=3074898 RepID=UPI00288B9E6B|nr:type III-B CRISPR module-associated protein Cmr5 [Pontibacter sp. G13]WNJ18627.1 type III-B CRISPR module-associated protein Cmr5 [Pontibacter sp. G13]